MKRLYLWLLQHGVDLVGFLGVGLMALGVGIQYSTTGAIAVFALGLPILSIQRHMRESIVLDRMALDALIHVRMCLHEQQKGERLTLEMVRDLHKLLKRIADEGITRE